MQVLGIDIGGTGIKAAPVDTRLGKLLTERYRIVTPHPSTPKAVTGTLKRIVRQFDWKGPIGCGVPAVVQQGQLRTAANISESWLGVDARKLFEKTFGCVVTVVNDADAAGYAEMYHGAGRGCRGTVMILTLGTGIGSALFVSGHLVPNTELGHLEIRGKDAEWRAADSVRKRKNLSWRKWAQRVDNYLHYLERYFWPDLFIIGGGVSKKSDKFFPHLTVRAPVVKAELGNEAGIIGAAMAHEHEGDRGHQQPPVDSNRRVGSATSPKNSRN